MIGLLDFAFSVILLHVPLLNPEHYNACIVLAPSRDHYRDRRLIGQSDDFLIPFNNWLVSLIQEFFAANFVHVGGVEYWVLVLVYLDYIYFKRVMATLQGRGLGLHIDWSEGVLNGDFADVLIYSLFCLFQVLRCTQMEGLVGRVYAYYDVLGLTTDFSHFLGGDEWVNVFRYLLIWKLLKVKYVDSLIFFFSIFIFIYKCKYYFWKWTIPSLLKK